MTEFFGSIWWLLVSLGLLVTFHEFGHYWVARRCGVRVLRFSVGFGKPLWTRIGKDGTEYVIAALPLGGYVRMLDEREVEVAAHERPYSFNAKSVWQRIAIVAAGPLANLLLCIVFLWMVFMLGKPDYPSLVSVPPGLAAEAGLRTGDQLLAIGDRETPTWTDAAVTMAIAGIDREPLPVRVRDADGGERLVTLPFDRLSEGTRPQDVVTALGMMVFLPARVGEVKAGWPADGRLRVGDLIHRIEGRPVADYLAIAPLLQELAEPGRPIVLEVERDGRLMNISVDPRPEGEGADRAWRLGILPMEPPMSAERRYGPLAAMPAALGETWKSAGIALGLLKRIIVGRASLENISGPITIARSANFTAERGPVWFLMFLGGLSLSLCIMNLLPIPVLDGGHLLYYLIELVKGSPVGERVLVAGQYVGLVFLAGLMGLAFYNDLFRPGF